MKRVEHPGLLAELVHEGALVFDIGANIGRMTFQYLALGAQVVAVEPQSVCINDELRPRFGSDERVTIVHAACGAEAGEIAITTYGYCGTISTIVPEHYWQDGGPWEGTPHDDHETVKMVTLDALIEEYGVPAFIKIDVEGYERQVLDGLSRFCPLSFEFHPFFAEAADSCMKRVLEIEPAAEFNYTEGEALTYASQVWMSRDAVNAVIKELWAQYGTVYFGNLYARKGQT